MNKQAHTYKTSQQNSNTDTEQLIISQVISVSFC